MELELLNRKHLCLLAISPFVFSANAWAEQWNERTYVEKLCSDYKDGGFSQSNSMDCQTAGFTIEFDWVDKFKEGIGQALAYSANDIGRDRKPGVVLICQRWNGEQLDLNHCQRRYESTLAIFAYHNIDARVWLCPYKAEALFECSWEGSLD